MNKSNGSSYDFSKPDLNQPNKHHLFKNIVSSELEENLSTVTDIINLIIKSIYKLQSIHENETVLIEEGAKVNLLGLEVDFYETIRLFKINLIKNALRKSKGRQNKAAKLLNIKKSTLNAIIKKYEIYL
ncbi:MAG: hypothetical protein HC846_06545 [Blastocatellia bacterium]|nr:hypothetical protein [Blastocatellia bacterium]